MRQIDALETKLGASDIKMQELFYENDALKKQVTTYIDLAAKHSREASMLKAQVDELKQELANVDRAVLIAERRVHGDQADKMEASQEAANYNWLDDQNEALKEQLQAKDAVIDVAVKALRCINSTAYEPKYVQNMSRTTLEQIQKMRGG